MADLAAIFTLHRYFIWANRMRDLFDNLLARGDQEKNGIELMMYMSLWYALLYVVVEGWKQLELADAQIDQLLESPNVELLRRYRNGVFHFQPEYLGPRLVGFVAEPGTPAWVRELNLQFGRYFLAWFREAKRDTLQAPPG